MAERPGTVTFSFLYVSSQICRSMSRRSWNSFISSCKDHAHPVSQLGKCFGGRWRRGVRSVPGASSSAPRGSCPSLLGGRVQPESCCPPAVAGDPPARCAAWKNTPQTVGKLAKGTLKPTTLGIKLSFVTNSIRGDYFHQPAAP